MKRSDSYPSVVQGVSQQSPSQRDPGRLEEQVNMIPDPVEGLCRRHGSVMQAETALATLGTNTPEKLAAYLADTATWRTFEYSHAGSDYVIVFRTAARPVGSTLPVMFVYERTSGTIHSTLTTAMGDTATETLAAAGIANFRKMLTHVEQYAPLRRSVTIEDVGNVAAFLSSDLASGVTGEITYVDAGYNVLGMTGIEGV